MFKIYDGRDKFYQWDIDRKLIVEDATIAEVHFCNRTDDCSLVCETYLENGLTVVNVPNVLLQSDWTIRAYAFDKYYTKFEKKYEVVPRTKPTDYVYTETETVNYSALLERMNTIDENIAANVEQYIQENPVKVDLTNYYDKQESDDRFALKDDVPDGVATEKYVDNAISKIELMPGKDGKDGDSGIYVGTTAPTEPDKLIWINPEGEASDLPSGGVSSWNDLTDKPFGDIEGNVELIPETTFTNVHMSGVFYPTVIDMAVGDIITVIWNGEVYEREAIDASAIAVPGAVFVGNQAAAGLTDTGEPFYILALPGYHTVVGAASYQETLVVSVYKKGITTRQLDVKYIPVEEITEGFITIADVEAKGYQTATQVNALINTALGVIENGTY